ncbi:GNAT family N-acetyltransferase [Agrobacterium sp. CNPSo 3708]|uniref:GNAT family N-acetyltransferase n=2 Tax=Agrobacterium TaxID=357 RepID=UPI00236444AE|nr:GNAT family N-acetyltransferase [Agrobacterium sp. CNPSo 3708]MDD1498856.1 GNAT family N-acetyltransferase [Agrobacterium sp. CNPSo 3708]
MDHLIILIGIGVKAMGFVLERFELRRLRAADAPAFRHIRLQALYKHPEAFGASWADENEFDEPHFAKRLESGYVIGGFSDQQTIVGTIGIKSSQAEKTRHIASIWGMYVSPSARSRGLGRLLLMAAISELEHSVKSIRLCVEANNGAAINLYESVGFRRWALEAEALKVGDTYHDEILMRLDVT